jgi:hypothetical protein
MRSIKIHKVLKTSYLHRHRNLMGLSCDPIALKLFELQMHIIFMLISNTFVLEFHMALIPIAVKLFLIRMN